jgi:hypothetical protein
MNILISKRAVLAAVVIVCLSLAGCKKKEPEITTSTPPPPVVPVNTPPKPQTPQGYDLEAKGIPKFATADYIELSRIFKVSTFRSGIGHDYADAFEQCRSMKHYYQPPFGNNQWGTIKIYSPINGSIAKLDPEWAGTQVHITSDEYPDFTIVLFHVKVDPGFKVGDKVTAAQLLGTHIGTQTSSDIAVRVNTTKGFKLISWFNIMKDDLFQKYKDRGVTSRTQLILSKEARDADPLNCTGEAFGKAGSLTNWVELN